ncbi:sigma-70 family RNA polymerase sigma factor [Streptomyces sp. SDr-06]|uniref:BACON domain-containing protein n=1 Tax=Streptomyces sp. SDr-06 TaxID=2267702 RepID=UPI000DE87C2B|nr:sigma-70 family RNA polymerase sigma factor [Streptomyces sp. SDr-06]RCH61715.1 sigma-70 family RNA polymerase sigma factor [Streptomyces sp. SDr-06]
MTSSRLDQPAHNTGAHRAQRRAPRTLAQRPPARYEAYLDGLFTYCLSVLCDHDEATAALGDILAVSERQYARCPAAEPERKAWLYALARWACLRKLAERRRARPGAHTGRPAEEAPAVEVSEEERERRRGELALLAWPEAAGTTPEQREALELAVRHQLGAREVASVLGMNYPAARELLAAGACEVERTRAALAVVEMGGCPTVAQLTGDHQVLLSAALRRELVRHVDDCPRCRRAAERTGAAGPWPGSTVTPAALPLAEAPRAAAQAAMLHVPRARGGAPRFDRTGFPMDPKDRAARRDRLRARAVTTTVVATVVAAPVFALWAAYRGAPATGEPEGGAKVTASEADTPGGLNGRPSDRYENAGNARSEPDNRFTAGSRAPDVSVEVISPSTAPAGPAQLSVAASSAGDTTVLTLTSTGGAPVDWSLRSHARWLAFSQSAGRLAPGQSVTVYIRVDHTHEPHHAWAVRVEVAPSGAAVRIAGDGTPIATPSSPDPGNPGHPGPPGSSAPPTPPTQTPGSPTPTPTPPSQSPTPTATPTPTQTPPSPTKSG